MEKLSAELDFALRQIAVENDKDLLIHDLRVLISEHYITPKFGGGWTVNVRGLAYLDIYKD